MPKLGYTLYCEGNPPKDLVRQAVAAEEAEFDFLVISDHYHPWLTSQSHSAFAWSVLGAVAQATDRIELATMVTCPIMRYHPAIVAQMAATVAVLSDERFTLGLGAGERLNEHVVGRGWPPVDVRHEMLREAVGVIRELWDGGYVTHRGDHFVVEDARVFDLPRRRIPTYVAAGGTRAAELAADIADGVCATEPDEDIVSAYPARVAIPPVRGARSCWHGPATRRRGWPTLTPSSGSPPEGGRCSRSSRTRSTSTPPRRRSRRRIWPGRSRPGPTSIGTPPRCASSVTPASSTSRSRIRGRTSTGSCASGRIACATPFVSLPG